MQTPQKTQSKQHAHNNSRVAERVAPQASLAPAQAPLAMGALSERLVPPFLQSVHLLAMGALSERLVPPFLQSVHLLASGALSEPPCQPLLCHAVDLAPRGEPSNTPFIPPISQYKSRLQSKINHVVYSFKFVRSSINTIHSRVHS